MRNRAANGTRCLEGTRKVPRGFQPCCGRFATSTTALNYLAPLARLVVGAVHPLASILEAYRTGGGVPYAEYGVDLREGQAGINRAMFLKQLGARYGRAAVNT